MYNIKVFTISFIFLWGCQRPIDLQPNAQVNAPSPPTKRCGVSFDITTSIEPDAFEAAKKRMVAALPVIAQDLGCDLITISHFGDDGLSAQIEYFSIPSRPGPPCGTSAAEIPAQAFPAGREAIKKRCHNEISALYEKAAPQVRIAIQAIQQTSGPRCTDIYRHLKLLGRVSKSPSDVDFVVTDLSASCKAPAFKPKTRTIFIVLPSHHETAQQFNGRIEKAIETADPHLHYVLPGEMLADGWWKEGGQ